MKVICDVSLLTMVFLQTILYHINSYYYLAILNKTNAVISAMATLLDYFANLKKKKKI